MTDHQFSLFGEIPHISKMPSNSKDADALFDNLIRCGNCINFGSRDMFGAGKCSCAEFERPFLVFENDRCECFWGNKIVNHWLNRLVNISLDCDGSNDAIRI